MAPGRANGLNVGVVAVVGSVGIRTSTVWHGSTYFYYVLVGGYEQIKDCSVYGCWLGRVARTYGSYVQMVSQAALPGVVDVKSCTISEPRASTHHGITVVLVDATRVEQSME